MRLCPLDSPAHDPLSALLLAATPPRATRASLAAVNPFLSPAPRALPPSPAPVRTPRASHARQQLNFEASALAAAAASSRGGRRSCGSDDATLEGEAHVSATLSFFGAFLLGPNEDSGLCAAPAPPAASPLPPAREHGAERSGDEGWAFRVRVPAKGDAVADCRDFDRFHSWQARGEWVGAQQSSLGQR